VLSARDLGNSVEYVLNQPIETTLAKDRDFVEWRRRAPARNPSRHRVQPDRRHAPGECRASRTTMRTIIEHRVAVSLLVSAVAGAAVHLYRFQRRGLCVCTVALGAIAACKTSE
jgi:hypothetical protein